MKHPHLNITLNETGNNMISLATLSRFDTYGLSFICWKENPRDDYPANNIHDIASAMRTIADLFCD